MVSAVDATGVTATCTGDDNNDSASVRMLSGIVAENNNV
jgi:hypothetical protein